MYGYEGGTIMQPLTSVCLGLLIFLVVIYIGSIVRSSRMEDVKYQEQRIKELDKEIKAKEKILREINQKIESKEHVGGDFTKWRSRSL